MITRETPENKVVKIDTTTKKIEQIKEQTLEKTEEELLKELYQEMWKVASENNYDGEVVFRWVFEQVIPEDTKMRLWGNFVQEIVSRQTIEQIRAEYVCLKKL